MRKHKRSGSLLATRIPKFNFDRQNYHAKKNNKRGDSAKGCSLLPLALRPRLSSAENHKSKSALFSTVKNKLSNNSALRFSRENLTFVIPILSITILAIFSLFCNNANVSAVSATLSVPEDISVNANPSVNNGFVESSNGAVSVSTGNQMGYTLTIKAKDSNQLKNGSNVLNSISTNLTADQYKNGDYVNTWGMKPSSINSNTNTSYVPGPTTSGITIAETHMNTTTAENYSLGIAAKVDSNTIAGNYTNTFTISATANDAHYYITFNTNGGSGGPTGQAPQQTGLIGSSTYVNIAAGTPTYSGKDFLGWCSVNPGTGDTCNGVLVQPGGQFPLCKCDLNITLYAMYGTKSTGGAGDFIGRNNGSACRHNNIDGIVYGGLCWMWSNLNNTTYTWENAKTACTSAGWRLPSKTEFEVLLQGIGSGAQLYRAGWTSDTYWSSTLTIYSLAYALNVNSSSASLNNGSAGLSSNYSVRCVAG